MFMVPYRPPTACNREALARRTLGERQLRSRKLFAAKIILVADEGSRREQDNLGARVNCCENNSESGRSEQEDAGAGSIVTAHVAGMPDVIARYGAAASNMDQG